ncbi:hypothetical protein [Streptomyces sp. NPDC051577]|uniref:hypothetical protein n=1 Tax=Streptomyces sp. NPDC051577 TaxID=3155166 RepID=UPI00343E5C19
MPNLITGADPGDLFELRTADRQLLRSGGEAEVFDPAVAGPVQRHVPGRSSATCRTGPPACATTRASPAA